MSSSVILVSENIFKWSAIKCRFLHPGHWTSTVPWWYACFDSSCDDLEEHFLHVNVSWYLGCSVWIDADVDEECDESTEGGDEVNSREQQVNGLVGCNSRSLLHCLDPVNNRLRACCVIALYISFVVLYAGLNACAYTTNTL
jgi:hypothetical protein